MLCNARTDLYTLYFLLFALFILSELAFKVLVLAVIDNSTNGRLRGGRYHHQVHTLVFSESKSLPALHNPKLVPFGANDSDIAIFQHTLINFGAWFGPGRSSKSCYVRSPLLPIRQQLTYSISWVQMAVQLESGGFRKHSLLLCVTD